MKAYHRRDWSVSVAAYDPSCQHMEVHNRLIRFHYIRVVVLEQDKPISHEQVEQTNSLNIPIDVWNWEA